MSGDVAYRTFAEWSADGYKILKGSKHEKRNDSGEPLFSSRQVSAPFAARRWENPRRVHKSLNNDWYSGTYFECDEGRQFDYDMAYAYNLLD